MGKSSPKQPAAPDPVATAGAQAAANKESAIAQAQLNQVNQVTPYGSMTWGDRGTTAQGIPQSTVTQTLAPAQQQMLDLTNQAGIKYGQTANAQLGAVSDRLAQPLDFSSMGAAPQVNEATRQASTQAILQRMQPQMDQDRMAMETRLANQGIGIGSAAYNAEMDRMSRATNDARLAADAQGGNEMARLYQLESAARDRGINEMMQQRSTPINELAALLTGAQVQGPQFVPTPQGQIQPADVMGATYGSYNGQLNAYNSANQQQAADRQGLYSLLGTGAQAAGWAWSDRRLKADICPEIRMSNGLTLYSFRYLWNEDRDIGYMADEVAALYPAAVKDVAGFSMVNYARVP